MQSLTGSSAPAAISSASRSTTLMACSHGCSIRVRGVVGNMVVCVRVGSSDRHTQRASFRNSPPPTTCPFASEPRSQSHPQEHRVNSLPSLTSRFRRAPHSHRAASEYGAVLDMVVDRASTAGFLVVLGVLYPQHLFVFQALLALDFTSHWMHMKRYARACARAWCARHHLRVGHMSAGNTRPPLRHMATLGVIRRGTMRWFCGLHGGAR